MNQFGRCKQAYEKNVTELNFKSIVDRSQPIFEKLVHYKASDVCDFDEFVMASVLSQEGFDWTYD